MIAQDRVKCNDCHKGSPESCRLTIQSLVQSLLTMGKRPLSSDGETDDSGFGSDLSPPFTKVIKIDEDSGPFCGTHWSSGFVDRRSAFAPASNENCKVIDTSRFYFFNIKYPARSRDGRVELKILSQPEEQHRARYMTEGQAVLLSNTCLTMEMS